MAGMREAPSGANSALTAEAAADAAVSVSGTTAAVPAGGGPGRTGSDAGVADVRPPGTASLPGGRGLRGGVGPGVDEFEAQPLGEADGDGPALLVGRLRVDAYLHAVRGADPEGGGRSAYGAGGPFVAAEVGGVLVVVGLDVLPV